MSYFILLQYIQWLNLVTIYTVTESPNSTADEVIVLYTTNTRKQTKALSHLNIPYKYTQRKQHKQNVWRVGPINNK